jgi:hypothetical protein
MKELNSPETGASTEMLDGLFAKAGTPEVKAHSKVSHHHLNSSEGIFRFRFPSRSPPKGGVKRTEFSADSCFCHLVISSSFFRSNSKI